MKINTAVDLVDCYNRNDVNLTEYLGIKGFYLYEEEIPKRIRIRLFTNVDNIESIDNIITFVFTNGEKSSIPVRIDLTKKVIMYKNSIIIYKDVFIFKEISFCIIINDEEKRNNLYGKLKMELVI